MIGRPPIPDERFLRGGPVAAAHACVAHRYHWPRPPYAELHHVVPRAWQALWQPEWTSKPLWDDRTEPICPTGHRTVHLHIVLMMRAGATEDPRDHKIAAYGNRRLTREQEVAYQALCRWRDAGGSLQFLRERRAWGG